MITYGYCRAIQYLENKGYTLNQITDCGVIRISKQIPFTPSYVFLHLSPKGRFGTQYIPLYNTEQDELQYRVNIAEMIRTIIDNTKLPWVAAIQIAELCTLTIAAH